MGTIKLENIKVFACHGCLREETIIGSNYRIDLAVKANLTASSLTDDLKDTVDYVLLNSIVKEEMNIPTKLLETVAKRILNRIFLESNLITKVMVSISKINPPIGGDVEMVTIKMKKKRKKGSK